MTMDFVSLNTPEFILCALKDKNIVECTEIQEKTMPLLSEGKDVVGSSRTGSGKTFAYAIPACSAVDTESGKTQILVVCPTRELAAQIVGEFRFLNTYREGCKTVPVFGGINMARQVVALKKNAEIVVGTPGRLVDHLKRKTLKLDELKMLVLDEADEMLKMGFKEEVEAIIRRCPEECITAMFSATMPDGVIAIAEKYMRSPQTVKTDDEKTRSVTQFYVRTGLKNKFEVLKKLILRLKPVHSIVFCNTKRMVDKLQTALSSSGIDVSAIHGDMRQQERAAAIAKLKNREASIMIATDVAARGIDIEGVDVVFNFDVPQTAEYYVHRIGRTGRADKKGIAFTLINTDWGMKCLDEIVSATGNTVSEYEKDFGGTVGSPKKKTDEKSRKERAKYAAEHEKPGYVKKGELLKDFRDMIEKDLPTNKKSKRSNKKPDKKYSSGYANGKYKKSSQGTATSAPGPSETRGKRRERKAKKYGTK